MPPIRRIEDPFASIIADADEASEALEASQDPADYPTPTPSHRTGNQHARTHGIYAAVPPDPLTVRTRLHEDIRAALKRADHRAAQAIGDTISTNSSWRLDEHP